MKVPPGNNVDSEYRLRVEGAGINGGAIIFENETMLEFSRQFLSISISTNKAVYDGGQDIRFENLKIHAIMSCWLMMFHTKGHIKISAFCNFLSHEILLYLNK